MTYIVIHPKQEITNNSVLKIIEKHLQKPIKSFEGICFRPDICIIEEKEKGSIGIEQIKILQKKLLYSPFSDRYQFGIIKNAQLMTPEAQNALLKTLEECSQKTILILTVNTQDSVLQTILSRCTRIYPHEQKLENKEEDLSYEKDFLQKPIYEQVNEVEDIVKNKKADEFLENLIKYYRNEYNAKMKEGRNIEKETEAIKLITQAKNRIKKNTNVKIALEYICFKLSNI